jgi:hypothetical protein
MIFQEDNNTPTNQTRVESKQDLRLLLWGVWVVVNYFDNVVLD